MKAMVVSPVGGRVPATTTTRGSLISGGRRDLEAEEVAAYLGKLRDLVPDMPRKRKLSKLEVIQRVIQYICELETTLEKDDLHHHPASPRQQQLDHDHQVGNDEDDVDDDDEDEIDSVAQR